MKKTMKKLFSVVLSLVMVLSLVGVVAADEAKAADGYNAVLKFANGDWSVQHMEDDGVGNAKVTGDGTYTVSMTADWESIGITVFCIDIVNFNTALTDIDAVKVSDVKVVTDGKEVAVDQTKVLFGNIEDDNDHYRIEIFNEYGDSKMDPPVSRNLTWSEKLEVTFTLSGTGLGGSTETPAEPETPAESVNTYYGCVGIQQADTWNYRNDMKDLTTTNYNFTKQVVVGGAGKDVAIEDANITADGTYTAKISGLADCFPSASLLNLLFVSTDIPMSMSNVKFTDITVKVDGKVVKEYADDSAIIDPDEKKNFDAGKDAFYKLAFLNIWNPDLNDETVKAAVPQDSVEITFTVSGVDYTVANPNVDVYKAVAEGTYTAPEEPTEPEAPAVEKVKVTVKAGAKKVEKMDSKVKSVKLNKKAKKVVTVKTKGKKVTFVGKKAGKAKVTVKTADKTYKVTVKVK